MAASERRLIWYGALRLLLGLVTGFVMQEFRYPRMGLAAHLKGVWTVTTTAAMWGTAARALLAAAGHGAQGWRVDRRTEAAMTS